jgi:hypothetical protein
MLETGTRPIGPLVDLDEAGLTASPPVFSATRRSEKLIRLSVCFMTVDDYIPIGMRYLPECISLFYRGIIGY